MELYHIADIHLGAVVPKLGSDRHLNLVMQKLRELFGNARQEGIQFIVMAGDVFDSNTLPSSMVGKFVRFLKKQKELQFILIPGGGNKKGGIVYGHDAYSDESIYKRPDISSLITDSNVHLLTPESPVKLFLNENIAFYGGFFGLPVKELAGEVKYHVAVMHGPFGNRPEFGEIEIPENVEKKFNYIALGHYHGFKRVSSRAYYSGAFIQFEYLPVRDATSGYLKVKLKAGDPEVQYVTFEDAPAFIRMGIMNKEDFETFKNLCSEGSFVKITEYLEDFDSSIEELLKEYHEQVDVGEGARIRRSNLIYMELLEELIARDVPEEFREEVKEFLLYGLQVSSKKSDVERFIRNMYHL